jgi:heat shock 70kDa protein 4
MQQQDALLKYVNPVLLVSDMKKKAETLDRFNTVFPR